MSTRTTEHDAALAGETGGGGGVPPPDPPQLPYLLDFFPLQDPEHTQISHFFDELKAGRLVTSHCTACDRLHWPPRVACDTCTADTLEWKALPGRGKVFAYTAMMLGAPLGFEKDIPFVIAVIELEGAPFKILTRVDEAKYEVMSIGMPVELKVHHLQDGRVFYRFKPSG